MNNETNNTRTDINSCGFEKSLNSKDVKYVDVKYPNTQRPLVIEISGVAPEIEG